MLLSAFLGFLAGGGWACFSVKAGVWYRGGERQSVTRTGRTCESTEIWRLLSDESEELLSECDVPGETCNEVEDPELEEEVFPSVLPFWRSERWSSNGMILETGLSYAPF